MSVFGSLFTAVSGLSAQSQSIGMISNNIANVSTVGYKRRDAAFSSLVTSESRTTLYSPGSVRAVQNTRINQQGILQQSNSSTDVALTGNGFFVVKRSATDGLAEPLYTRAGSFSEDSSGVLRNTSGFFLMGWPLDQDGNLPASQADISSLVPVDVAFLGGLTQPTSTASIALNIDSAEDQSPYPVTPGFIPDFARGLKVYDSLGEGHDLTINYKKVESPTAMAGGLTNISEVVGPMVGNAALLGMSVGDSFTLDIPSAVNVDTSTGVATIAGTTATFTIGANTTVAQLVDALNSITDVDGNPVLFANLDAGGGLDIKMRNLTDTMELTETSGNPLGDLGFPGAQIGSVLNPPTPPALFGLTPTDTYNTEGWWYLEYKTPTGALVNGGYINFGGDGRLNAEATDIDGSVDIPLNNIDWGNGSNIQDITFDIQGFTQFSGEYNVISTDQNGAELGLRTGVSIDREGFVIAQFSNGQSAKIYKVPVATFANANGLNELTGNVYRQSDSSGDFNLREAGLGSAGQIEGGALEASNVDLADEFSKMIVTQRAYSANTKVISTADQMTQELLQLR